MAAVKMPRTVMAPVLVIDEKVAGPPETAPDPAFTDVNVAAPPPTVPVVAKLADPAAMLAPVIVSVTPVMAPPEMAPVV